MPGREDVAAGDPSRSRHECRRLGIAILRATIATYFCLAVRPAAPCRIRSSILDEYIRVLADPKFKLTNTEIRGLLEEELIPFIETVTAVPTNMPDLRAPDDAKFIACAVAAGV